jgi:hypothetical protein
LFLQPHRRLALTVDIYSGHQGTETFRGVQPPEHRPFRACSYSHIYGRASNSRWAAGRQYPRRYTRHPCDDRQ